MIGDERFFAMLRDWTTLHRHASVTTRDFIDTVHRHDRRVPESFWQNWLYSSALPTLPDPS
jgi:aminopeptidase N